MPSQGRTKRELYIENYVTCKKSYYNLLKNVIEFSVIVIVPSNTPVQNIRVTKKQYLLCFLLEMKLSTVPIILCKKHWGFDNPLLRITALILSNIKQYDYFYSNVIMVYDTPRGFTREENI